MVMAYVEYLPSSSTYHALIILDPHSNKWVLNTTATPLFFLLTQLVIAIILFLGAHFAHLIQIPLELDLKVCKGLIPMVALNVIGLRYAHVLTFFHTFKFTPIKQFK